jgi:outer membrane protein OmpA-like peptidoglycan-associated protein
MQGTISPFANQPGVTLTSHIARLPLTTLGPFLEPHWGYAIKSGTLDFDHKLSYENTLIQDNALLTLHDLTLGQPLAAPAIKAIGTTWQSLPLVQAMLQDAAGTIKFTVPIDGRTDTGFTYQQGMKSFLNQLLLKASVSPLNLLRDHQRAQTDTVEFEPGSDRLTKDTEALLREFADLLQDRPLLAVDLAGLADSGSDGRALLRVKKPVAAEANKGQPPPGDELLLDLATRRAQAVQNFLLSLEVPPQQLHVLFPEVITSTKAGRAGHRVAIGLTVVQQ